MLGKRSYSWAFCWTLLIICQLAVRVASVNGKKHLRKLKDSRILAVRGQILTKLGRTSPPIDKAPGKTSTEDLEAYQAVVEETEKQHGQELECAGHVGKSNYFAKRVVRLPLNTRFGRTIQFTDTTSRNLWIADVNTITFNTEQLNGESHIELAELRFNPEFFSTTSLSGLRIIEICLNNQPHPSQNSNSTLPKQCSQVLDSRVDNSKESTLVTFVITGVVKDWVFGQESNNGIKIVLKQQDTDKGGKEKKPGGSEPYVLVWYVPTDRFEIEKRRRHRRSLDSAFCNKRLKEKRCCLRPLYINFQRDLRWNWIHAPLGFHANYCKGKCPFMWSMDNQTHHTSIMALFNSLNPDAPSEPCCVARAYKPLVILYYEKGKAKIEELGNMVVTACTCL